jgi:hypothetical protein
MSSRAQIRFAVLILAIAGRFQLAAADDVLDVARRSLPAQTNAVVAVQVKQLLESEAAQTLGWNDRESGLLSVGGTPIPVWIETVVRGAHIHPGQRQRDWTISIANLPATKKFTTLARAEDSYVQQVSGQSIYLSPRDAYFAQIGADVLGAYAPADRQELARWLARTSGEGDSQLSPYLQEALQKPSQLTLAVDLSHVIDQYIAREWMKSTAAVGSNPTNSKYYADLMQSLRGFTFSLHAGAALSAEIRIDFDTELRPNATQLKEIVGEYLLDHGSYLDDLDQAVASVDGKSVVLAMPNFSESGVRRILSVVLSPTPEGNSTAGSEGEKLPPSAGASRHYFQAIAAMIDDLERKNRSTRDYLKTATWHENYAKQIDQLPTGGVDPDLLTYGRDTSGQLRALSASLRGVPLEVNTLESTVTYDANYDPGWISAGYWSFGYQPATVDVQSNLADVRQKQAEAIQRGAEERESVWLLLTQSRTDVGQAMSQKYQQAFEKRSK